MSRRLLLAACALLLSVTLSPAWAERLERFGDYEVHYNAFPSAFLKPEVAQAYKLLRSRVQGVVMISVLKDGRPLPARIDAQATNELGQLKALGLREVREAGAIYYVGNVGASEGEVLRIAAEILPEAERTPFTLNFSQQFFGD